ncbi:MAG: proteasome accessory factor [Actinomycetota bacterium]|nr:proteasome accessory factor [Actinomycetota bacterium]
MTRPDAALRLRRLLTIIPWIVDHQGSTLDELAARFGMKLAELERDLELVPFCGLPPYTPDRLIDCEIVDGRVFLRFAEYFARPLSLTPGEGFALLAAGQALLAVPGADPSGSLAAALGKLAGVLGAGDGMAVELGAARYLEPLRAAAGAGERVEIDYYTFGRDELTTRRIDPRAVFAAAGQWYVDAYCHRAGDDRLFRVDRVRGVRPTGEHFEAASDGGAGPTRPGGSGVSPAPGGPGVSPVPGGPGGSPGAIFNPRPSDRRVTLLLNASAAWVPESYPMESVDELPDGRLRVVLVASERAWLERLLLRLGPAAEVLDPAEVRVEAAEAARRLLVRYG